MNAGHQEIKCNVHSCKYNDQSRYCTLYDITVGHTNNSDAKSKQETECASFECM